MEEVRVEEGIQGARKGGRLGWGGMGEGRIG